MTHHSVLAVMKINFYLLLSILATEINAAPVPTCALVVNSHGSAKMDAGAVHTGQLLPASSELTVPNGATGVDLQLTGDATYASANSSPAAGTATETLVRVEPGSVLSLSKLEATDTGIETVRQINLHLIRGTVLISARRVQPPSSFDLRTSAGRIAVSEGVVEVSASSIAVASGRVTFYPCNDGAVASAPIVLMNGHSYDVRTHTVSQLSPAAGSAIEQRAAEFHSVGLTHFSSSEDHDEDCISPVHPIHHHHHYHPHFPQKNGQPPGHASNDSSVL